MVYDCFTFFNELDLLEIRLNVLNEVVDKFVLVEMARTFQRKPKPLYFEENKQRFEKFKDKIIHIKVSEVPEVIPSKLCTNGNTWQFECYQRDCIMQGLQDAEDDDIIMISDVDEIPEPEVIKNYIHSGNGIFCLEQKMMYYFMNNINCTYPVWRNGTRIARFKELQNPDDFPMKDQVYWEYSKKGSCNYFRNLICPGIKNGGWHFSYCGGVDQIIKKRTSFSETNLNTEKNMSPDEILHKIYIGKDILDRKEYCYKCLKLNDSFPKYIRDNQELYSSLILHQNLFQKIANFFVIVNCRIYIKKGNLQRKLKQAEKSIRRTLSPCKKFVFRLLRIYK